MKKAQLNNIDSWIKELKRKTSELGILPLEVSENRDNIQHTYELLYELKDELEEVRQELHRLKLIQILSLKK